MRVDLLVKEADAAESYLAEVVARQKRLVDARSFEELREDIMIQLPKSTGDVLKVDTLYSSDKEEEWESSIKKSVMNFLKDLNDNFCFDVQVRIMKIRKIKANMITNMRAASTNSVSCTWYNPSMRAQLKVCGSWVRVHRENSADMANHEEGLAAATMALFEALDVDDNNGLTVEEFMEGMGMVSSSIADMMTEVDSDVILNMFSRRRQQW
eukprot:gnl/MRDRNA2_/MRDRNA2_223690_c0_seq1.p1 gnl/MRDRNA2_/MRDRNA2_223690_c0~~gnl/MRDRNA2_/MRDRNA2_223690_c0_seq1.p1  ORF type:complete len:211 (-),score=55.65 gnl/MRDRNA2_/MRDRNA2_223690_c0_seq1:379-1011(-)